mgnify:CR=1 FL=1
MTGRHAEAHRRSLADKNGFWLDAAKAITWTKAPARALDDSRPPFYRWFLFLSNHRQYIVCKW